jgi:hypothetical protein
MIPKRARLRKLGKAKVNAKRGDFGVKKQAVLRFNSSCFEEQLNLD